MGRWFRATGWRLWSEEVEVRERWWEDISEERIGEIRTGEDMSVPAAEPGGGAGDGER